MAEAATTGDAYAGAPPTWSETYQYLIEGELFDIALRRQRLAGAAHPEKIAPPGRDGVLDVVGLAISGGGVRSAAIGLGVLQALNDRDVLKHIDYLSTVSGGGYIGCALSSTMSDKGDFVFGGTPGKPNNSAAAEIADTPAVGHLRNYSNYLIPNGFHDGLSAAAVIVRGLVANLGLLLPAVLALAILTIYCNPQRQRLSSPDFFGFDLGAYLSQSFGLTLAAGLALLLLFFLWALLRSRPEVRTSRLLDRLGSVALLSFATIAFFELQPFVIEGMFQIADGGTAGSSNPLLGLFTSWVKTLAAAAAPVTAVVVFFQRQLGGLLKNVTAESSLSTQAAALLAKAAVWVAGLALPLLIWVFYLYLCFWGIENDCFYAAKQATPRQQATISTTVKLEAPGLAYSETLQGTAKPQSANVHPPVCPPDRPTDGMVTRPHDHVPGWLNTSANKLMFGATPEYYLRPVYWLILLVLAIASLWMLPNANSLHQLYRDRLGKAFLFDPYDRKRHAAASREQGRDFIERANMPLSKLSAAHAPYHLINAALNIQGSDFANRRGRNADFFMLSRRWIGSDATGYAATNPFQHVAPDLDLATAMAISGAAASANMGAQTIRPLTPTLAILNIRLGYWLKNPMPFSGRHKEAAQQNGPEAEIVKAPAAAAPTNKQHGSTLYLWRELSGRLYEDGDAVLLTDGGHIENLGIYELLRRRCRLIVAVDAEADSSMHFPIAGDVAALCPYRSWYPHQSAVGTDPGADAGLDEQQCRQAA
jgi:hypothetical protein